MSAGSVSSGSNFGLYSEEGSSKSSVLQVFRTPVPDEGLVCGRGLGLWTRFDLDGDGR